MSDHVWSVTEPASLKKTHVSFTQNKQWHPTIGKIQNLGGRPMSLLTVFSLKNTGRKFVPLTVPSSNVCRKPCESFSDFTGFTLIELQRW